MLKIISMTTKLHEIIVYYGESAEVSKVQLLLCCILYYVSQSKKRNVVVTRGLLF